VAFKAEKTQKFSSVSDPTGAKAKIMQSEQQKEKEKI